MKPENFDAITTLMEKRTELINIKKEFEKDLAFTNADTSSEPEISIQVRVRNGKYATTMQEDYRMAIAFIIKYIRTLEAKIGVINTQLKPL